MSEDDNSWKMVLIVRTDLGMGKGKIAAQCSHAAVGACLQLTHDNWRDYKRSGQTKVVVKVNSLEEFETLEERARAQHIIHSVQIDSGLTQIPENTKTVLAIGPAPSNDVDSITGLLRLL